MIERLKFFVTKHPFVYCKETGDGMAMQSYSIISDTVTVRHSLRGYVTGYTKYKRQDYISEISDNKWILSK